MTVSETPTPKRPPDNLPLQLSSFIGREREVAELKGLLFGNRLVTLTGPGGSGKTRLALETANELVSSFDDGVWLVELASLSDPDLVVQTVAFTLGVREQPGRLLTETLSNYLKPKKSLLVMDNCEHLISACARLAETLLRACPRLRVLSTSREALGITGEVGWPVPPLSLPGPRRVPTADVVSHYEAGRLFIERAKAVVPSFALTKRNAEAIERVCHSLDGMPLAIELAAARVKLVPVEQIAGRLDRSLRLLTGGSRTALPRHQTLRATIEWSYELLSKEERVLFRRLSVFAGGFTLEAAEAVCAGGGIGRDDIFDLLSHLVDKSLVVARERGGEERYRLLETVRQYAEERLLASGEARAVPRHHTRFFLSLAEEIEPRINSKDRRLWLERLETEHDNFRAALRWTADNGEAEVGLRLARALWWFWLHHGYWSEGRRWLEGALDLAGAARTAARAKALNGAGFLAWTQGDHAAAHAHLQESVEIWRELGERYGLAYALQFLSCVMLGRNLALSRSLAEESVALFRAGDDAFGLTLSLATLGISALSQEDYAAARPLLEEAVETSRRRGDTWALSLPLRNLGILAFRQGDYARAEVLLRETLILLGELEEKWFISRSLESLAAVNAMQGDHGRAARLWGAGEAMREAVGASVLPLYRADYDRGVAAARSGLGEEAFRAAWAQGRAMTLEEAIEYALQEVPHAPTTSAPTHPAGLTDREVEVLRLVAKGLTDAQIAKELFVSRRTVNAHARAIYAKLEVNSRAAATRFAIDNKLV